MSQPIITTITRESIDICLDVVSMEAQYSSWKSRLHSLCLGIIAFAWAVSPITANAETSKEEKESLSNIAPIAVYVSKLPDWSHDGLTREQIKEHILQRLHKAGISISPDRNGAGSSLVAVVSGSNFSKSHNSEGHGLFVYTLALTTLQNVYLIAGNHDSLANTWSKEKTGVFTTITEADQSIMDSLDKHLDSFIADYNSVNLSPIRH